MNFPSDNGLLNLSVSVVLYGKNCYKPNILNIESLEIFKSSCSCMIQD